MNLFYNFLLLFLIHPSISRLDPKLIERLSREERNALCCAKKMRCCHKPPQPPEIEIRAVLVRCPNTACDQSFVSRSLKKPVSSSREHDIRQFQGFDEDEPLKQNEVRNCHKKLLMTMKINNKGPTNCKNEFVVVDHVYDPVTEKRTRLLNPYVIKIKQEAITQMYGLKFLHVVNSEAREDIYNKHQSNYTGCNTGSAKPTCGTVKYHGKIIPFSTGFCCSCDALKNSKRQPETIGDYPEPIISYSDPAYLLDGVECPRNLRLVETLPELDNLLETNQDDKKSSEYFLKISTTKVPVNFSEPKMYEVLIATQTPENPNLAKHHNKSCGKDPTGMKKQTHLGQAPNYLEPLDSTNDHLDLGDEIKKLEDVLKTRTKRQVQSSGSQRRGGQNCADRYTPKNLNPEVYHESTHCLRFSDLWYTVYHLQEPIVQHSILLQIFEKHEDPSGRTRWNDLTKGKMIRLGTFDPHYTDEFAALSVSYKAKLLKPDPGDLAINHKMARLLIPEGIQKSDLKRYPEASGGPSEYLIVHPNQISIDGDQCNVAGIGFEAFFKQPNRCSVPKGSCLANQPKNLWLHDYEAERNGKRGCFFLKHYGNLPDHPIRKNASGHEEYLDLEYVGKHTSVVDIELKADFNAVLRPQTSAKITEVYIDSTSSFKTLFIIKITNAGLTSSNFKTKLSDCPLEMPAALNKVESKLVLIPPQHQHIFNLEVKCKLPADRFHCSVEVLNAKMELIAIRRIRIQRSDRCICTWHCLCACVGSEDGLRCIPMSLEHYHASGFQGALPVVTSIVHYTFIDDMLSLALYFLLFLFLTLLALGITKALIGLCCCSLVGIWGLNVLLDIPKRKNKNPDQDFKDRPIEYDEDGWPIDPETKKKMRNFGRATEFCLNVVFFFTYPVAVLMLLIKRLCCPYYAYEPSDSECFEEVQNIRIARCGAPVFKFKKTICTRFKRSHDKCKCEDCAGEGDEDEEEETDFESDSDYNTKTSRK